MVVIILSYDHLSQLDRGASLSERGGSGGVLGSQLLAVAAPGILTFCLAVYKVVQESILI